MGYQLEIVFAKVILRHLVFSNNVCVFVFPVVDYYRNQLLPIISKYYGSLDVVCSVMVVVVFELLVNVNLIFLHTYT